MRAMGIGRNQTPHAQTLAAQILNHPLENMGATCGSIFQIHLGLRSNDLRRDNAISLPAGRAPIALPPGSLAPGGRLVGFGWRLCL